jgi:hypothetical protein
MLGHDQNVGCDEVCDDVIMRRARYAQMELSTQLEAPPLAGMCLTRCGNQFLQITEVLSRGALGGEARRANLEDRTCLRQFAGEATCQRCRWPRCLAPPVH